MTKKSKKKNKSIPGCSSDKADTDINVALFSLAFSVSLLIFHNSKAPFHQTQIK